MKKILFLVLAVVCTACLPVPYTNPMHIDPVPEVRAAPADLDIDGPAEAGAQPISASRLAPPEDPVQVVNSLPYGFMDLDTATDAFHRVTASRGWSLDHIAAWTPFVRSIIARESKGCPGVRYGQSAGPNCQISGRARGTAAGFGQVIYKSNRYLCGQEGLCSHWDIIASPWNSMTALVALIEHSGKHPWCYTASLKRGSICRSAP